MDRRAVTDLVERELAGIRDCALVDLIKHLRVGPILSIATGITVAQINDIPAGPSWSTNRRIPVWRTVTQVSAPAIHGGWFS